MKLNVNTDMVIKNVKLVELNTKIVTAFLNSQTLGMISQDTNVYAVIGIIKKILMKA